MAAQQCLHLGPRPLVGDVGHVEAELLVELVREEMGNGAGTERGIRHLARVRLDPCDKLREGLRGHARMGHQHHRRFRALDDADEIGRLPAQVGVGARIDLELRLGWHPQRVAVGRHPGDVFGGNVAVGPGAVFHDHGLAEQPGERPGHRARVDVRGTPRLAAHHQRHGLRRPLRRNAGGNEDECGKYACSESVHVYSAIVIFKSGNESGGAGSGPPGRARDRQAFYPL